MNPHKIKDWLIKRLGGYTSCEMHIIKGDAFRAGWNRKRTGKYGDYATPKQWFKNKSNLEKRLGIDLT